MPALSSQDPARRKAAYILGSLTLFEAVFFATYLRRGLPHFLMALGFLRGPHTPRAAGWLAAAIVTAGYVALCARLPSVRAEFLRPSGLKLLAIALAIVAGCLEEICFRAILMDSLRDAGHSVFVQIVLSGLGFGLIHGIWALFRGSWVAGVGAITATGILGIALAIVYVLSGRSLAPCVAAHFALDVFAEPGLVLAAVRGEMSRR